MDSTAISSIHISQVSFDATQHTNEFGYRTGWIELVNNSDEAICLRADCWSISNDRAIAALYFIRNDVVIKANGNIIVWCDNLNAVQANLHTNFKLNKENGRVELYHINEKQDFERVDFLDYKEVVKTIATVE